jgi:hypothetical protein
LIAPVQKNPFQEPLHMKNLVRIAVVGILAAGAVTVHAAPAPIPNVGVATDLIVFVYDATAGTTYVSDTGITVSSLLPTGSLVSGANLDTSIAPVINHPDAALGAYITAAGSHALQWGVIGAQQNTGNVRTAGTVSLLFSSNGTASNIAQGILANLTSTVTPFAADMTYLVAGGLQQNGGQSFALSAGSVVGNVWGAGAGATGGSTDLYGNFPSQLGVAVGSTNPVAFYGLTGNGGTGQAQSYVLATSLTLSSNGTLASAVPLPAAVWLFGSGLLGLAGVGRRRAELAA